MPDFATAGHVLPYSTATITKADKEAVLEALSSGWQAGNGPISQRFEHELAEITGFNYAVVVNSGTAALHCAIATCFPAGATLTAPSLSFVATANAIVHAGCKVSLIDCDPETLTADEADVAVAYAGYPVAGRVVVDSCHALRPGLNNYDGVTHCVSFHPVKHVCAGEGGAVLTDNLDIANNIRRMRNHGQTGGNNTVQMGYNYRMPELNAALGLSQLARLEVGIRRRHQIAQYYYQELGELAGWIELPVYHERHAFHLFPIRVHGMERDRFRQKLFVRGVGTQVHYKPIHLQLFYESQNVTLPVTEREWAKLVSIPMYPALTDEEVERVVKTIREAVETCRA